MVEQQQIDKLRSVFAELKEKAGIDSAGAKKLELPKVERLVARLVEFSGCLGCQDYVVKLTGLLQGLTERFEQLERSDYKALSLLAQDITTHLEKEHQLIPDGYYIGTYIALGVSLGLIFGMNIFDNLPMGLGIGLSLGVAIGAGLDGDAKKKGRVI